MISSARAGVDRRVWGFTAALDGVTIERRRFELLAATRRWMVLADAQREWTPFELVAVAEAGGPVGEPGGPFHYSNTNYVVLGEIIEQVTGHSWADEVRSRIVEPLGMSSTDVIGE